MSAVVEASGLGKRYRRRWALADCTLAIPAGRVVGLVGPNGAGKDHAPAAGSRAAHADRGRDHGSGQTPRRPGAAARSRLRRPGHPDLRGAFRGRPSAHGRLAQPGLGRRAGRAPGPAARPGPAAAGRLPVRRAAGPARPDPRGRQAARAAAARRAGRQPGPARPAGIPAGPDGDRRRVRGQRRALLASDRRRRAGVRLPRRAHRLAGAGGGGDRGAAGLAPPPSGPRRDARPYPASWEVIEESHTDRQSVLLVRTDKEILDPAWTVKPAPGCSPTRSSPRPAVPSRPSPSPRPAPGTHPRCSRAAPTSPLCTCGKS